MGVLDNGMSETADAVEATAVKVSALIVERDRLRVVADAARRWRASYDRDLADLSAESEAEHLAAIDAVVVALDALDASGVMGGEGGGDG